MRKKQIIRHYIDFSVGIFLIFIAGYFYPTWSSVSRLGVQAICILLGGIWLIANHFGLITPSLLIMVAMLTTGYTDSGKILASSFGSATVWQLITIFVLLYALSECDAEKVLARWIISRKYFNGRPALFSGVFLGAVTLLGAFASALGAYLFGRAMVDSIAATAGYDDKSQWKKAMTFGVLVTSSIGGGILPFKGMALLIYNLMATSLGEAGIIIDQSSYIISAVCVGLFTCVALTFALKILFRVDFAPLANVDIALLCADGGTRFSKRQAAVMLLFTIGILYAAVPYLPKELPFNNALNSLGQGFWFALMMVLMDVIHIDGVPLLNLEKNMFKSINWGVILGVCAFTSIGGMISSEELGVQSWLSRIVNVVFGDVSFPVFVGTLVLMTLLLTNILTNVATAVMISTIAGPFLIQYGLMLNVNVSCVIPGIVMSALCAFLTMAAGGSAPLFLSESCIEADPKWVWTYGLMIFPLMTVSSTAACLLCAYIV